MIKPYLLQGARTFEVLSFKDGHTVSEKKRSMTTDVLWCEEKDLPTALVNHAETTKLEIWNVWELGRKPIKVPCNCHECQSRCSGCLESCPVLRRI